MLGKRWRYGQ